MEVAGYTTLARQSALKNEMQIIANNIANAQTTGFRQEGIVFSEYLRSIGDDGVSMTAARIGTTSFEQGGLRQTGGAFDLAIEGPGFFQIETPQGVRLTRNGAFAPNAEGQLVTLDGYPVLDAGAAPVFLPPGGVEFAIAEDGTISSAGTPVGQVGLVLPEEPDAMTREGGVLFAAEAGVVEVEQPRMRQGFLESSNVNAILQVARMVEVQRAYELGQSFLEREDERVRSAIKAFMSR